MSLSADTEGRTMPPPPMVDPTDDDPAIIEIPDDDDDDDDEGRLFSILSSTSRAEHKNTSMPNTRTHLCFSRKHAIGL